MAHWKEISPNCYRHDDDIIHAVVEKGELFWWWGVWNGEAFPFKVGTAGSGIEAKQEAETVLLLLDAQKLTGIELHHISRAALLDQISKEVRRRIDRYQTVLAKLTANNERIGRNATSRTILETVFKPAKLAGCMDSLKEVLGWLSTLKKDL